VLIAGGSSITSSTQRSFSLYRSDDAGKTWQTDTVGLPHTPIVADQVATSPRGTLVLAFDCWQAVASTPPICFSGLARSTDAGRSWQQVGPRLGYVQGVVALGNGTFVAAAVPFVGQHSTLTLLRSSDDGQTWHVLGSLPHHDPLDLATLFVVPWTAHKLLAGWGIMDFLGSVSQSVDGGAHWPGQVAVKGVPLAFAGLSATHTLLLSALSLVYRSTDGGQSWTAVLGSATNDDLNLQSWAVLAAPDGRTAYVGAARGIYRSTDDGRTWQLTTR
jgi:photosystem II stability/assembly factor-like uncharacterized protein